MAHAINHRTGQTIELSGEDLSDDQVRAEIASAEFRATPEDSRTALVANLASSLQQTLSSGEADIQQPQSTLPQGFETGAGLAPDQITSLLQMQQRSNESVVAQKQQQRQSVVEQIEAEKDRAQVIKLDAQREKNRQAEQTLKFERDKEFGTFQTDEGIRQAGALGPTAEQQARDDAFELTTRAQQIKAGGLAIETAETNLAALKNPTVAQPTALEKAETAQGIAEANAATAQAEVLQRTIDAARAGDKAELKRLTKVQADIASAGGATKAKTTPPDLISRTNEDFLGMLNDKYGDDYSHEEITDTDKASLLQLLYERGVTPGSAVLFVQEFYGWTVPEAGAQLAPGVKIKWVDGQLELFGGNIDGAGGG